MREYQWRRRQAEPDRELWRRAKKRAAERSVPFALSVEEIIIPARCPVLGIELRLGEGRTANSPSLDRIEPELGYVSGNVRVVSDKANRLKGARDLPALLARADQARGWERSEFLMVAEYVRREMLLKEVRAKTANRSSGKQWGEIADFLEQVFARGQLVDIEELKRLEIEEPTLSHDMMII